MNICIDIGNTNVKIGIFNGDDLVEVNANVADRKIEKLVRDIKPENIIVSTVRKGFRKLLSRLNTIGNTLVFTTSTKVPIEINYKTPETLGLDRIASVVGAAKLYEGKNCLVVDLGTCITYDLIDSEAVFQGGGISPGVEMRLKAMHKFTSKLPKISSSGSCDLMGKSTTECMKSGAIYGAIAEVSGIIYRYRQFFDEITIIFCGGDANFFESKIKDHIFANPNLVLVGLNQILRYNLNE